MPTILINTNLNNKIRYKDRNDATTTPTVVASNDTTTSSGDGGLSSLSSTSTSASSSNGGEDTSYDLDAEFRQDLNTIITKLLNKSQTMESFTIKYDIEDLMLTTKTNTNPASKNDPTNARTNNNNNNNNNCETHCICHRMARLFNDLLNNKPSPSDESTSTPTSLPSSNNTTLVSIEPTSAPTPAPASTKSDVHLESIYKELKLLRKYQFDLDSKFNLLLNQFNTSNRLLTNASRILPSTHPSSTATTTSHPFVVINPLTVASDNNRIKYSSTSNSTSNSNLNSTSTSASLTGAKKRKFNSCRLIPSGSNLNSSSMSSSSKNIMIDSERERPSKSPTSNHLNSSRSASASSSSSSSLSTHSSKSLTQRPDSSAAQSNTKNVNKSPVSNNRLQNSLIINDKKRHLQQQHASGRTPSHRNIPTSHATTDTDYLMKSEKFESEETTTTTNDDLNEDRDQDHEEEDDEVDELDEDQGENSCNVNNNNNKNSGSNDTSNETNELRHQKTSQHHHLRQDENGERENGVGRKNNNNSNDEDVEHIENEENEPDPEDENEFDNDLVDELDEEGDPELEDDDDDCLEDDVTNKTDLEFCETLDDMDEPGCYPSSNASKSQLHHRQQPGQGQTQHHHQHHQAMAAAAAVAQHMTQLTADPTNRSLLNRNQRNTSLSSALNLAQNRSQHQQQAAMAAAYLNYQNQLNSHRQSTFSSPQSSGRMVLNKSFDQMNVNSIHHHHQQQQQQAGLNRSLPGFQNPSVSKQLSPTQQQQAGDVKPAQQQGNYPTTSYLLQQQPHNQPIDIDLNELFKGNGPKYLQMDNFKNFKPPIVKVNDTYFVEDTMAALSYSKSKSRRNFAAHLTKLVFTPRERLESNCNGRFGKKALDSARLLAIRNTIFKYYPCKQSTVILNGDKITSGDHDENSVWVRDCIPAIDESNRVLKKQLVAWYKKNHPDKFPALAAAAAAAANNSSSSSFSASTSSNAAGFSSSSFNNTKNEYQMSSSSSNEYYAGQYQNNPNDVDQDFEEFEEQD